MKKKLLSFVLATLASLCATAQYSDMYYHREGDTIVQTPNNGYFMWWDFADFYDNQLPLQPDNMFGVYGVRAIAQQYHTENPLTIIGVAAVAWVTEVDWITGTSHQVFYTADDDNFLIYQGHGDAMLEVARVKWFADTLRRTFRIKYYKQSFSGCCQAGISTAYDHRLYEFYFDSAVTVTDTFYVAATFYSDTLREDEYGALMPSNTLTELQTAHVASDEGCSGSFPCGLQGLKYKGIKESNPNDGWVDMGPNFNDHVIVLMYPIIQVDTTVPPPDYCLDELSNFQATTTAAGCMTASWDGFPNYSEVQVVHGPITVAQADWDTAVVVGANVFTVCDIDTAEVALYGFKARAVCGLAGDTTEWAPLQWVSTKTAIDDVELADADDHTRLVPNPAQGSVSVRSQHSLLHLDIYNARGILVYSERITGHDYTVSLEGLPAGLYMASITTTRGTTVRRLLVR